MNPLVGREEVQFQHTHDVEAEKDYDDPPGNSDLVIVEREH
jgi:hypothetical protein